MPIKAINVEKHEKFPNIFKVKFEDGSEKLATKNLSPGFAVYEERLIKFQKEEYRLWDPYRSKLSAAILKGVKNVAIKPGDKVLYLGASTGTTASHVSDIVGEEGLVFCVEISPHVMRKLIEVCEKKHNMISILGDATKPETYAFLIGQITSIYCDVATPEQAKLLSDNADTFLIHGGEVTIAIKARSIDVTEKPEKIFAQEINTMEKRGLKIVDKIHLEPFSEDHAMVIAKYNK